MDALKIGNMETIAWHLEQGQDNGGISREALAAFLRGVVDAEKSVCQLEYIGQLGSEPFSHIWRCNTHPHNFFSKERNLTGCDKNAP